MWRTRGSNQQSNSQGSNDCELVVLDEIGRPASMLDHGDHFLDAESIRIRPNYGSGTPMDFMLESVKQQNLARPKY